MAGNVRRAATITAESAAIDAAGGGPEDPVGDAAAVANESRAAGAAAGEAEPVAQSEQPTQPRPRSSSPRRSRSSGGPARAAWGALPSSGPSPVSQGATKVIWAIATGVIVLEVMSVLTGKYWSWNTRAPLTAPQQSYVPLYGAGGPTAQNPSGSAAPGIAFGTSPDAAG